MTKKIIEASGISKAFKVRTQEISVLKKMNLEINEGEFVIVFGPSGCGKSTLLHILLGLEEPTSGTLNFFYQDIYVKSEDERSEFRKNYIGMIYQQPNWIKSLSVIENVCFPASLLGFTKEEAHKRAHEMLKLVKMDEWSDYLPTELSSGQQQKISLARALVTNPRVIIADEPTGNLDYQSGIDLMNLFQKLQQEGKTVIMVSHNVENLDYATQVIHMFDGNIIKIFSTTKENVEEVKKAVIEKLVHKDDVNPAVPNITTTSTAPTPKHKMAFSGNGLKKLILSPKDIIRNLNEIFRFVSLLGLYLLSKFIKIVGGFKFTPRFFSNKLSGPLNSLYLKIARLLDSKKANSISRIDLIDISLKNMFAKRIRSLITIGGMSISVGTIVFLVSIGYGLEKVVIARVAHLDEVKQIDASAAVASNVKLTDKSLAQFKNIGGVDKVLPVISVVGKVNYQNSSSDVAVYGVLSDYLKESAIKPSSGQIFASNEFVNRVSMGSELNARDENKAEVAGAFTDSRPAVKGEKIGSVTFTIAPDSFLKVRSSNDAGAQLLGYTRRVEGEQQADEVWGGLYITDDKTPVTATGSSQLGKWLHATVPLWEKQNCKAENGCEQGKYIPKKDIDGHQIFKDSYFAEIDVKVDQGVNTASVPV